MVKVVEVGPTSKNTHNDFLALSTHSDQMSKLQKLHLSVKQASTMLNKSVVAHGSYSFL